MEATNRSQFLRQVAVLASVLVGLCASSFAQDSL